MSAPVSSRRKILRRRSASQTVNNKGIPDTSSESLTLPGAEEASTAPEEAEEAQAMSLREHLLELRSRILKSMLAIVMGFFICYSFAMTIFDYLVLPLNKVLPPGDTMIFTGLAEGFLVEMYVALVAGFFVAIPVIFYQFWAFISPGLYKEEKRYIIPIAFFSVAFFTAGMAFCYFVAFPFAFKFFMTYSRGIVRAAPTMQQYFNFTIKLLFAFGIIFELPLFSFFFARMGILKAHHLRTWRKYAIVGCFIVAAILTPPDVLSQLLMVGPLLVLYELSILVVALAEKKDTQPAADKMADSTS